ncbi:hypothetical protein JHK82_043837 [Glycine max]|nr:hypothetical protein JHK87_043631 [Glycine soja]KAG4950479.1 hypothetical protein JHK86_043718 [Glycine max]KAG4958004.1 hypothetical protein JHK85_044384 [Glycine max]KAG5106867.1 hypothetical protein JHK82_043837 [Glycine max]KAG5117791.1 hypothetical protein JHK84_043904 [Glycine max]
MYGGGECFVHYVYVCPLVSDYFRFRVFSLCNSLIRHFLSAFYSLYCKRYLEHTLSHTYVVGAIDEMDIDGTADINDENSDKTKGKCKFYVGSQSLGYRRDHMEVLSPLKNGVVVDWNIVDNIWDHALRLVLITESGYNRILARWVEGVGFLALIVMVFISHASG